MTSTWLSSCLFHSIAFRRAYPMVFLCAIFALLAMLVAVTAWLIQLQQAESSEQQLRSLQAQTKPSVIALSAAALPKTEALPKFEGAPLVDTINQVAADLNLPVDEISYALEDGAAQPYLRYRMTLSIASNYPMVRRFTEALGMNLPNATLDSISCAREDVAQPALTCDLAFSMFFRKETHG